MKILQVRFKNLNSLVGEWEIDLSHPQYVSDGIFAIIGPTGAGKSTILDAICLALYARTPRLPRIAKGSNEIMSRQTSECFAEVTFQTQAGRYRCHWSQHRARRKPSGELQAPKHEIAEADTGEVLESKIRGVAEQIEALTGMDFDRFTRSMLLAQGGFAAFLQARSDDRAPILEQITGTEIYSELSIHVHGRHRKERDELSRRQADALAIAVLSSEEEQELVDQGMVQEKEIQSWAVKATSAQQGLIWLNTIAGLKAELVALQDEHDALSRDRIAFHEDQQRLNLAQRAASLEGSYGRLVSTRKEQADDQNDLARRKARLPEVKKASDQLARQCRVAQEASAAAKKEFEQALPLWRTVRHLDQKLMDYAKLIKEDQHAASKLNASLVDSRAQAQSSTEKRTMAETALQEANAYFQQNAAHESLLSELAGIKGRLGDLEAWHTEIKHIKSERVAASAKLAQATQTVAQCRSQLEIEKSALEKISQQIGQEALSLERLLNTRSLREYRQEREALQRELFLLNKIAQLEDHRAKLQEGHPCPLCGAHDHPYAQGNVPVMDKEEEKIAALTAVINQAEAHEISLQNKRVAHEAAGHKVVRAENELLAACHQQQLIEQTLGSVASRLEALVDNVAQHEHIMLEQLQPMGIVALPLDALSGVLSMLTQYRDAWQAQLHKKEELEQLIARLDSELMRLQGVIDTQQRSLEELQERIERLLSERTVQQHQRLTLYADKDPDEEERRTHEALRAAESAEKESHARYIQSQQDQHTLNASIDALQERIERRANELVSMDKEFAGALAEAGFANEVEFKQAIIDAEAKNALIAKAKALDERETTLKAKHTDRKARLATEQARALSEKSAETLQNEFEAANVTVQELQSKLSTIRHILSENTAAKKQYEEKQIQLEAQRQECQRWDALHELIGSADGKKYRNFAQGLTFELMVRQANRQLEKMSDRYVLVRDRLQPLELNVIDNYQAGEERSTRNLSGGESFIVSLSLALGLSQMASKNVRVDSLFLDEGFGTLDEEALDIALDTLAGLQQDGKLIGVISHVPALKERISTQILVQPLTGGRSQLVGPGCRKRDASVSTA